MPAFAREHNRSNPVLWRDTEWLKGFCLLFRRALFEEIGYWDEGFEIGNYEDNDYNIRVRLAGKRLVIAADTFIHHFGSVSIRAIGKEIGASNVHNASYYSAKWNDVQLWKFQVGEQRSRLGEAQVSGSAGPSLYPQRVAVRGIGPVSYWIEDGWRRPVEGELAIPVVQVSQVDLRRWPVSEPIGAEEVRLRWLGFDQPPGLEAGILQQPDGPTWHIENRMLRQVISLPALESWQLHLKPSAIVDAAALPGLPVGLPIIALPLLRQKL